MQNHAVRFELRLSVTALAATLALSAAGCGKKGDEEAAGGGSGGASAARSAAAPRTEFTADAAKLFQGVPAEAFAVGFLDSTTEIWGVLVRGFIYELDAEDRGALDQELKAFLTSRIGIDLSKAKSAVAFGMGAEPDGAVLVAGVSGELKGRVAGTHNDVSLFALDSKQSVLAATRDNVLVIGSAEGVRAALDALGGKRARLVDESADLWAWIEKECGGGFVGAAAGNLGAAPPQIQGMSMQTGIERACVRLDTRGIRSVLTGDEAKLAKSAELVEMGLKQQLMIAEAMRSKGTAPGAPTIEGLTAILGYHYMKSVFSKFRPKLDGGRLRVELPLELGDTAFIVTLVGITAAVAIPAFLKYIKKSKSTEAREFVKRMYDGARSYYMDPGMASGALQPSAPRFPTPSAGPTPPLGTCCAAGEKCVPDASLWAEEPWVALMFSIDDPHYYSYQYEVVDEEREFVVRAFGDLDCDGVYSTFEMTGTVDPATGEVSGSAQLVRIDELE